MIFTGIAGEQNIPIYEQNLCRPTFEGKKTSQLVDADFTENVFERS